MDTGNRLVTGKYFAILGGVLRYWEVFEILGSILRFWEVFCDSGKCFEILRSILRYWEEVFCEVLWDTGK